MGTKVRQTLAVLSLGCALAAVGGCGSQPGAPAAGQNLPGIVGAKALSRHYVEVAFDMPPGPEGAVSANYAIVAPNGAALPVASAQLRPDNVVLLTTGGQEEVPYVLALATTSQLRTTETTATSTSTTSFTGSAQPEPRLENAIALDANTVLLKFSEAMDDTTTSNASYYAIDDPDGDEDIDILITGVSADTDADRVLVATTAQKNIEYEIRVTNVISTRDTFLIDPTQNTARFFGIPPDDQIAPRAIGAVATSKTSVLVSFSEPLNNDSDDPLHFSISPALTVTGAEQTEHQTQMILTTMPQSPDTLYTITVSEVHDRAGNLIDPAFDTASFSGISTELYLESAVALSNTTVLLSFNAPLAQGPAETASLYRVTEPPLEVVGAALMADPSLVMLSTSSQEGTQYTVRAANQTTASGDVRIDPARDRAGFFGIAVQDVTAPTVVSAASIGSTQVLVSFSEPLAPEAGDASNYAVSEGLVVTAAQLSEFGTQATLTTLPQTAGLEYEVTVAGVTDLAGNPIGSPDSALFTFAGSAGTGEGPAGANTLPKVVGTASLGNTSVMVVFNKPMGDSALVAAHYVIVQENVNGEVGTVFVLDNACDVASDKPGDRCDEDADCPNGTCLIRAPYFLNMDRTTVVLSTTSQNEVTYRVIVTNVEDLAGNELAPQELLVDPTSAVFAGTPPTGRELVDSDGDGLSDSAELRGRVVTVVLSNGDVTRTEVTSDPNSADTDADDLDDAVEAQIGTNPRSGDTDLDGISDYDEFNVWYSSPIHQDTDADEIDDNLEILFYKTSALFADTDGDQIPDGEEVLLDNRDPRIADLPRPRILIGNVTLEMNRVFSQTSEEGTETAETNGVSSTLTQANTNTFETSDEETTTTATETSQELSAGLELPPAASIGGSISQTDSFSEGYTSTFTESSTEATEEAYEDSFELTSAFDFSNSITETIEEANILVDVTVKNDGDIAFTIDNIEVSALAPDPNDRSRFIPVASLTPQNEDLDPLNLGPGGLVSERGPFVFDAKSVFPTQVDRLLKEPRGVILKLANFDLTDEEGRNFAFTSQEVTEHTAGITIDYGNGDVDVFHVATNSTFDANGKGVGITMRFALEDILGLTKGDAAGYATTLVSRDVDGSTIDIDILTRVKDVESGFDTDPLTIPDGAIGTVDPRRRFWIVFSSQDLDPTQNFDEITLRAGEDYTMGFVTDKDFDLVFEREEFLYGSSDLNCNTDGCPTAECDSSSTNAGDFCCSDLNCDGGLCDMSSCGAGTFDRLSDFEEIKLGWEVAVEGKEPILALPDPTQPDSDADALLDHEERDCSLDPRSRDTDRDGISDYDELNGYYIRKGDGTPIVKVPVFNGLAIIDGGNGIQDTPNDANDDIVMDGTKFLMIVPGSDGVLDTAETAINSNDLFEGDDFLSFEHGLAADCTDNPNQAGCANCFGGAGFATDPLNPDSDGDGISDGNEVRLSATDVQGRVANPNNPLDGGLFRDADRDGLADALEAGWYGCVNGVLMEFNSDPNAPDTDGDGLPDLLEFFLRSDPDTDDTDGDGLTDVEEFGGAGTFFTVTCQTGGNQLDDSIELEQSVVDGWLGDCDGAENCNFTLGANGTRTNLGESDTDGDGASDKLELDGWPVTLTNGVVVTNAAVSDPFDPDTDDDGWDDGTEYNGGTNSTHPNDRDTDDDLVNDPDESTICVSTNNCLDPLDADMLITFDYTGFSIQGDCDGSGSATSDEEWEIEMAFDWDTSGGFFSVIRANYPSGMKTFLEGFGGNAVDNLTFGGVSCDPASPVWVVGTSSTKTVSGMAGRNTQRRILSFGDQFRIGGWIAELDSCDTADGIMCWGDACTSTSPDVTTDSTLTVGTALAERGGCTTSSTLSCTNQTVSLRYPSSGSAGQFSCDPSISVSAQVIVNETGVAAATVASESAVPSGVMQPLGRSPAEGPSGE